ncbi:hypothetical protein PR202_ga18614 [Eleusine coracana subsp. coracana]|uniref:Uncharacterized protein n=1 Tax=Eleusine coracana subsp. coracana TaxID=191504 RepID=A0AAV5CTB6_ELECO|nr:hypothetical protein PR202_ga18614 [Eleusine coracana subsp. coracana]
MAVAVTACGSDHHSIPLLLHRLPSPKAAASSPASSYPSGIGGRGGAGVHEPHVRAAGRARGPSGARGPRAAARRCGFLRVPWPLRGGAQRRLPLSPGRARRCSGHVGTAARGAQLLEHLLGAAEFNATTGLAVLATREKAETSLEKGDAAEAEALLTEAIGLNACGGVHLVYSSRSKARLTLGNICGALEDAVDAIRIAPKFTQAHLLHGDALFAMGEYCLAEDAYADALNLDPSIRRSKSYKARVERLREKLVCVSSST